MAGPLRRASGLCRAVGVTGSGSLFDQRDQGAGSTLAHLQDTAQVSNRFWLLRRGSQLLREAPARRHTSPESATGQRADRHHFTCDAGCRWMKVQQQFQIKIKKWLLDEVLLMSLERAVETRTNHLALSAERFITLAKIRTLAADRANAMPINACLAARRGSKI